MAADPDLLDQAVRAFRKQGQMRWPCTCMGCLAAVRANYRFLAEMKEWRDAQIAAGALKKASP